MVMGLGVRSVVFNVREGFLPHMNNYIVVVTTTQVGLTSKSETVIASANVT